MKLRKFWLKFSFPVLTNIAPLTVFFLAENHRTDPHTPAQFPVHIKYRASPDGLRVAPVVKPAQKSTPFVCGRGGGAIAR
ncbi:TPA: hypothetical protein I8608_000341 [Morganella morganii]|uniref:Secreted protein n=1 Tax=Morganella morganii TaxID=582 RepID=A0AAN5RYG1_MORMO|nr:hypothetical protein [Morganella morganii]